MRETDKKWVIPAINKPTNSDKFTCSNCVACDCDGFCYSLAIWTSSEKRYKERHPDCPAFILDGLSAAALVKKINLIVEENKNDTDRTFIGAINELLALISEMAGEKC